MGLIDQVFISLQDMPLDDFLADLEKEAWVSEQVLWSEIWRKAYLYAPEEFALPDGDTSDLSGLPLLFAWARKRGQARPHLLPLREKEKVDQALEILKEILPTVLYPELWTLRQGPLLEEVRFLSRRENPAWSFSPFALLRFTVLLDPEKEQGAEVILHEALHGAIDEFVLPGQDILVSPETRAFGEDLIQLLVGQVLDKPLGPLGPFQGQEEFLLELHSLQLLEEAC